VATRRRHCTPTGVAPKRDRGANTQLRGRGEQRPDDQCELDRDPERRDRGMKVEAVMVPVSDVDRAKSFWRDVAWRRYADFVTGAELRVVRSSLPAPSARSSSGPGSLGRAGLGSGSANHRCHIEVARTPAPRRQHRGGLPRPGRSVPPRRKRGTGERPRSGTCRLRHVYLVQRSRVTPEGQRWITAAAEAAGISVAEYLAPGGHASGLTRPTPDHFAGGGRARSPL
jgi:hypothetical protein